MTAPSPAGGAGAASAALDGDKPDPFEFDDDEVQSLRDNFDPGPWIQDRSGWLLLRCDSVTGREIADEDEWPFDDQAYLYRHTDASAERP